MSMKKDKPAKSDKLDVPISPSSLRNSSSSRKTRRIGSKGPETLSSQSAKKPITPSTTNSTNLTSNKNCKTTTCPLPIPKTHPYLVTPNPWPPPRSPVSTRPAKSARKNKLLPKLKAPSLTIRILSRVFIVRVPKNHRTKFKTHYSWTSQ